MARTALNRRLAGTSWGASTPTLRTSTLAFVYAPAEYYAPVWWRSTHTRLVYVSLNAALRTITWCLRPTQVDQLHQLSGEKRQFWSFARANTIICSPTSWKIPPTETPSPLIMLNNYSVLCPFTRDGETLDTCEVG